MELWEVTNTASVTVSKYLSKSSAADNLVSEYSKILDEKISNIKADVQQMQIVQEKLDEISSMHEELTGEVKVDEDSGNANRNEDFVTRMLNVETVKRFMPDGSIMVTTYEGGKITDQVRHKPHMAVVPDYSAPPKPDGSPETELKPTQNFDLEMLLMM